MKTLTRWLACLLVCLFASALCADVDSALIISKFLTTPLQEKGGYVEVRNISSSETLSLAGVRLEGDVAFAFPADTRLAPGACLAVAADVAAYAALYPTAPLPVGVYSGALTGCGELRLVRAARNTEFADPVVDRVAWNPLCGWPATAAGQALVLIRPTEDRATPANWIALDENSVVDQTLLDWGATWRYLADAAPTGWQQPDFDDSAWASGPGPLGRDTSSGAANWTHPLATTFSIVSGRRTYYFRTTFVNDGTVAFSDLLLQYTVDDAAVYYLNGAEVARSALCPSGTIADDTLATAAVDPEGVVYGPVSLDRSKLRTGVNTLAVEVHQNGDSSTDIVTGSCLFGSYRPGIAPVPGVATDASVFRPHVPSLRIVSLDATSATIRNDESASISLKDWTLGDVALSGTLAAGATRTVSLMPPSGWLLLRGPVGHEQLVVDAVASPAKSAPRIVINEVAAQNTEFVNPVTGACDDWFELANPQSVAVDVSGWLLTDTLEETDPVVPTERTSKSFVLPTGTVLQPGEHLRIWTGGDVTNETDRTADRANLQAPFGLGKRVDALYLFDADRTAVDAVAWTKTIAPTNALGRWPDMTGEVQVLPVPTPGTPNRPPRFTTIRIPEKEPVVLDANEVRVFPSPGLSGVTWRLLPVTADGTIPSAFSINSRTGVLTWLGGAPGYYQVMICAFSGSTCVDAVPYGVTVRAVDTTKPSLKASSFRSDNCELYLTFSELLGPAALDPATWTLAGIPVSAVRPIANGTGVALTFAEPLVSDTSSELAAQVPDVAGNLLDLSLSLKAPSLVSPPFEAVSGVREPDGPGSRRNPIAVTEIAASPAPRADGRDLRFLELYNSAPYAQRVGGYRLSGGLSYTFPAGEKIPAHATVVLAPSPADVAAVYGLADVRAAEDDGFSLTSKIELRDEIGAQLAKIEPSDKWPWPAGAEGTGHSLVLARPSYGQSDPKAWSRSAQLGGSPGAIDPAPATDYEKLLVNEYRAHSPTADGFIELVNVGTDALDLAGCRLSLSGGTAVYTIPDGTTIAAHGFALFTESTLGFRLCGTSADVLLNAPASAGGVVIDAFRVPNVELDRSFGRTPDGGPMTARLARPTPGVRNALRATSPVVLNEIMYNPISGSSDDEYIELFNTTEADIDLDGWTLSGGIDHTFSTVIPAHGYKVAAAKKSAFKALYPKQVGCLDDGSYSGTLGDRSDTVRLRRPLPVWDAATEAPILKNVILEEVTYRDGGRWGRWADGGGSSLERVDPRADPRLVSSWADSDESDKSDWTTISYTGPLEYGRVIGKDPESDTFGNPLRVEIGLYGAGECLVDSVNVSMEGGENYVLNSSFEEVNTTWTWVGTHQDTRIESRSDADDGAHVLHLRACGRLHTGGNGVRGLFREQMPTNGRATVSARVRWLAGSPDALLRVRGNWIEAPGVTLTTFALGSPGKRNSRARASAAPDVTETFHYPALPRADEQVQVWARVQAPDGMTSVALEWAFDESLTTNRVAMVPAEGGWYRGVMKGSFSSGSLVAYHVVATSAAEHPQTAVYPVDRDCLVRWGETTLDQTFGAYRVWMTTRAISKWNALNKDNNKPNPFTFVYGNGERIIQNAGIVYGGSPLHMQGFSRPFNGDIDYIMDFPKDDLFLGDDGAVLCTVADGSCVMEQFNYSLFRRLGLPGLHRRFVRLYANGRLQTGKGIIEDTEKPGGDMLKHWFPDDKTGQLMKINEWYEYELDGYNHFSKSYDFGTGLRPGATLEAFTTKTDAGETVYRTSRYRWHWQRRSYDNFEPSDYTEFWKLIDIMNVPNPSFDAVRQVIDLDAFIGVPVVNHVAGNWDTYGYQRGKNMYLYKSDIGWGLLGWDMDMDIDWSDTSHLVDPMRISTNDMRDPAFKAFVRRPDMARFWWRKVLALQDALLPDSDERMEIEEKNQALRTAGISVSSLDSRFNNLVKRHDNIESQRAAADAQAFCLLSPAAGATTQLDASVCSLEGVAPFLVANLELNGSPLPVTWTTPTNWVAQVPLTSRRTALVLVARGEDGTELGRATAEVVTTVPLEEPADEQVVVSEILSRPARAGGGYAEVRNLSGQVAIDLGGWYFEGSSNAVFPQGTILPPDGCLAVAENAAVFAEIFGSHVVPAAFFASPLPPVGELRLCRPAKGGELADPVVDHVAWGGTGWPQAEEDEPLVLLDPQGDNNVPANWTKRAAVVQEPQPLQPLIGSETKWRYWANGYPGDGWKAAGFDDAGWPSGVAPLGRDSNSSSWTRPIRTKFALTSNRITYYFRTTFTNAVPTRKARLFLSYMLDDGAVVYLNGQELARSQLMPSGAIDDMTVATAAREPEGVLEGPFVLESDALRVGENVLAVEVHQNGGGSSDLVWFGLLDVTNFVSHVGTPGLPDDFPSSVSLPAVRLNEVGPAQTEIYNAGASSVSLAGWALAGGDAPVALTGTLAPGAFRSVALTRPAGELRLLDGEKVVDVVDCAGLDAAAVFGRFPDGADAWRRLNPETPGAANRDEPRASEIVLNEFMSQNGLYVNPVSGEKDDWFELVNVGLASVDLAGWIVTDTLKTEDPPAPVTKATKALTFPDGVALAPGEVLRVWTGADVAAAEPFDRANLQAPFGLGKSGDAIYLFDAEQRLVDAIVYNQEIAKTNSFGRWPHGTGGWRVLPVPTPGLPNRPPRFTEALLETPAVGWLAEGETQSLTNALDDVSWRLVPTEAGRSLPSGLAVDAASGVVSFAGGAPGVSSAVLCAFRGDECVDAVTLVFSVSPAGAFGISAVSCANGILSLSWEATAGATYVVETAPSPTGPWSVVPNTQGKGASASFAVPEGAGTAFFRIKRLQ